MKAWLWGSFWALPAWAWAEGEGMITIEVVEDPGFFERYGEWLYAALIAVSLAVFFWRRHSQIKGKTPPVKKGSAVR